MSPWGIYEPAVNGVVIAVAAGSEYFWLALVVLLSMIDYFLHIATKDL
jgi:hypothetical protein